MYKLALPLPLITYINSIINSVSTERKNGIEQETSLGLKITLWNDTVGYLTWDNSDWRKESSVFKYDSSFLEKGLDISPLQMSINSPAGKAGCLG